MKHWIAVAALVCFCSSAQAGPYFRLVNPDHVNKVAGAFIDPVSLGNTSVGTAVALVTHSTADGCLLPQVVCEDWSPALVGLSVNGGRVLFNMGPAVNLTPIVKLGLLRLLTSLTQTETVAGTKALLGSQPVGGPDVSVSFGPALAVAPIEGGVLLPVNAWKGRFRIFAGAALKF